MKLNVQFYYHVRIQEILYFNVRNQD
jgi:hypothetical protein